MATASIELQVISKLLTSKNRAEIDELFTYDPSYYSIFRRHIEFIFRHRDKYGKAPDPYTFLSEFMVEFPDFELIEVNEPMQYLRDEMAKNKQQIMLVDMFNKLKDLGSGDVTEAWKYIGMQYDKASSLDTAKPLDLIHDARKRSAKIIEYSKQKRIPTGFAEVDKAMYGGLSTVEELLILVARTNTGKSWVGVEMMESAQKNGFPVLYYSPEMQAEFIGTRFDTWREHFENNKLIQGQHTDKYDDYLIELESEGPSASVLDCNNMPEEDVTVSFLKSLVRMKGYKLLIIDGLSYMTDERGRRGDPDHIRYKNLCSDLFRLSKQCGCAVVVIMQANRDTSQNKDQKGDPFPNIYNIEGSDHPARIATQVFALRQIFDKHILDIRMEKSRNASNQKRCFSYSWDINTGSIRYITDTEAGSPESVTPIINPGIIDPNVLGTPDTKKDDINTLDDEDDIVEF